MYQIEERGLQDMACTLATGHAVVNGNERIDMLACDLFYEIIIHLKRLLRQTAQFIFPFTCT